MLRAFGHAIVVSQVAARCLRFALAATEVSAIAATHAEAAGGATKSGLRASVTRQVRRESTHCRRQQAYREGRSTAPVTHQAMATITGPTTSEQPLLGQVRHLRVVEPLDEPLLPARTAQAAATVGAMFKFQRFPMIANS